MKVGKKEIQGTIHELPIKLANMAETDSINPVSIKDKQNYLKLLDSYKLFGKNKTQKQKLEIVSKLKVLNFNESFLIDEIKELKAVNSYNRIIRKKQIEIEDQIRAGKNVKENELIRKGIERVEVNIPKDIRQILGVHEKRIKLRTKGTRVIKNKIRYYAGLNYKFLIQDNFNKRYFISYDKLQKIRRDGNVVEYLLNIFKNGVLDAYNQDKINLSQSDKQKWAKKQKVYAKIFDEVIEHNLQIATNKKYNKKFVKRDKNGKISKEDSEIPILMEITGELIELYIP